MRRLPILFLFAFICVYSRLTPSDAADPRPGVFLPETGARTVRAALQSLDPAAGTGAALGEDGKPLSFRLLPYTALWRFGAAGAAADEFRAGERVLLKLVPDPGPRPAKGAAPYALEIRDEISEQGRAGQCYRMASQDRDNYRVTLEPVDAKTGQPAGPPLTLEYGRGTFLVLREDPVYMFRVPAGTRLWLNMGFPSGSTALTTREVLDEASLTRFRSQQRLRLLARLDAQGGPGYFEPASKAARVRVFPAFSEWARRLQPGEEVRIGPGGAAGAVARVRAVTDVGGAAVLDLDGAAPGLKAKAQVLVTPVRPAVSYNRDVRPLLEVNCLFCHRDGDARSGYSLSTPERMRAGSRRGAGLVPGKSAESMLYTTTSGDRNPHMPPDRDLTPEQLALVKKWIDAGAVMD